MIDKKYVCAGMLVIASNAALADAVPLPDGAWRGSVNAGFSAASGNSTSTSLNGAAEISRTTATDKFTANLFALYGTTGSRGHRSVSDNLVKYRTEYDYDLTPKLYVLTTLDAQRNDLQDLNFSSAVSFGVGRHVMANPATTFNAFTGLSYNYEMYKRASRNYPELLLGEESSHRLTANTSFTQRLAAYPNLGYRGAYRTQLDVGLVTSITDRINLKVALSSSYQNRPVSKVKKTDTTLITSIGYSFGNK